MKLMKQYSVLFCCFLGIVEQRCLAINELPANLITARTMLQDGTLDSLEWSKIEPFYDLPIIAPAGELSILQNLYPQLLSKIPISGEALRKYEPWSDYDIVHFFHDYPELLGFQPILDFTFCPGTFKGRAVFTGNKSEENPLAHNRMQISFEPLKFAKITGKITFSDNYIRWDNRLVQVSFPADILLQMGNIDEIPDQGLFFGYFKNIPQFDDSLIISNWLYGKRQLWNGISLAFNSPTPRNNFCKKVTTIAHKQPNEQIAGLIAQFELVRKLSAVFGVSGVNSAIPDLQTAYIFTEFKFISAHFKTRILTGLNIHQPTLFPLFLNSEYLHDRGNISCRVITYPKNGCYPYSKLWQSLRYASNTDSSMGPLTRVVLESSLSYMNETKVLKSIELDYSDSSLTNLNGSVQVNGFVNHLFWNFGIHGYLLCARKKSNDCTASITYSLNRFIQIALSEKTGFNLDRIVIVNAKTAVSFSSFQMLNCKPFVEFSSKASLDDYSIRCGISTTIRLLHDAESKVTFDCPMIKNEFWKGCHLECKASFVF
jgi:hypothetical protein